MSLPHRIAYQLAAAIQRAEAQQRLVCAFTGKLWHLDDRLQLVEELRTLNSSPRVLILEDSMLATPMTHVLWLLHDAPTLEFSWHACERAWPWPGRAARPVQPAGPGSADARS